METDEGLLQFVLAQHIAMTNALAAVVNTLNDQPGFDSQKLAANLDQMQALNIPGVDQQAYRDAFEIFRLNRGNPESSS
ncbi:hypothetical protein [Pseudomonas oryzihabitans]|uniref:hypothetical protein n=1 Tax=Pseudomonas oryzihabitans TaxID=47885 RepID=UPI0011A129C8|nr:hypothetical protein [Pseudomonas oryzihabitans]